MGSAKKPVRGAFVRGVPLAPLPESDAVVASSRPDQPDQPPPSDPQQLAESIVGSLRRLGFQCELILQDPVKLH